MKPIRKPGMTILGAPTPWDEATHGPCEGLPVASAHGYLFSYWSLNWRERLRILVGHPVRLCVASTGHPPVELSVTDN